MPREDKTLETLKIGKRVVDKKLFVDAVKEVNEKHGKITDVIEGIGFNPTVSTTRIAVTKLINELRLEYSNMRKFGFAQREDIRQSRIKEFKLSKTNKDYLDRFLASLNIQSRATYKASCGNFLQQLGTNDFTRVSPKRIMDFANQKITESMKKNVMAHIRSMMIFCVNNNINESKEKVSKDMLIWLINK
jgi:hypothetical protein